MAYYTFQSINIPGADSDQIEGIDDVKNPYLSGSYTVSYGGGAGDPYPSAFVMSNAGIDEYGADGAPYGQHSVGYSVNNATYTAHIETVGNSGHYENTERAFELNNGTFQEIDGPNNTYLTTVGGVNDSGYVAGTMTPIAGGPSQAFIWYNGSVIEQWSYPGASSTQATNDNDWGQTVGNYTTGQTIQGGPLDGTLVSHGYLEYGGTFTPVDVPGAVSTDVAAINLENILVGTYYDGHNYHGFEDNNGKISFINAPGAADTWLTDVSQSGQMTGYADYTSGGPTAGFVVTPGTLPDLINDFNVGGALPSNVESVSGLTRAYGYYDPSAPTVTIGAIGHPGGS